jgi:hypothetical protein
MSHPSFNEWRRTLARNINNHLGLSINKLPDFPFESWWKDGISARDAVDIIRDELGEDEDDASWDM